MTIGKRKSIFVFTGLILFTIITMYYGQSLAQSMQSIRVWDWLSVGEVAIGLLFISFQKESGFPELLDKSVSNNQRFLYPLLLGLCFAVLDILVFQVILHPAPYKTLPPFLQPFPYSIFLYTSGAVSVEVMFRLIPLTLLMWLVAKKLLKGKYDNNVFIIIAILTSLREPLEQLPDGQTWLIIYSIATGFLMNLSQVFYFRKAGFLASLNVRLGHYLLWHVLLGIYVQYVQIG